MSEHNEPAGHFQRDTDRIVGTSTTQTGLRNGGVEVGVRREGRVVVISLTSENEYSGIELYERLVRGIKSGALHLELGAKPAA